MASLERVGVEAFEGGRFSRRGTWTVAFLADWCPFCRTFEPAFGALASHPGMALLVADVTDEGSPLWDRFRIDVVPSVLVFRDGVPIFRADGLSGYGLDADALVAIRAAALAARAPDGTNDG